MHLWATLPRDTDDLATAEAASRGHVIVMPGRPFFPAEAPAPHLRLTFSQPVCGPVLIGRARHFGLGLCIPDPGTADGRNGQ